MRGCLNAKQTSSYSSRLGCYVNCRHSCHCCLLLIEDENIHTSNVDANSDANNYVTKYEYYIIMIFLRNDIMFMEYQDR